MRVNLGMGFVVGVGKHVLDEVKYRELVKHFVVA